MAPDLVKLEHTRDELLGKLGEKEQAYLIDFYQPKESSFAHAFTTKYPNLGVHSSQRNESYHRVQQQGLSTLLSIAQAVEVINRRTDRLGPDYDDLINKEKLTLPRLVNK